MILQVGEHAHLATGDDLLIALSFRARAATVHVQLRHRLCCWGRVDGVGGGNSSAHGRHCVVSVRDGGFGRRCGCRVSRCDDDRLAQQAQHERAVHVVVGSLVRQRVRETRKGGVDVRLAGRPAHLRQLQVVAVQVGIVDQRRHVCNPVVSEGGGVLRVEAREAVEQVVLEAERRGPSALELGPEVSDRDPVAVCGEVDGGAVLAYEAAE